MKLLELYYKKTRGRVPYYSKYSLRLIITKPIRKWINVVLIPNIPFSKMRVFLYRLIGFQIGRNVFIGMKCYMDNMDPKMTVIEDNVTISYCCKFSVHGRKQSHTPIRIKRDSYIGLNSTIISGKNGITIGERCIIGAGSVVVTDIPSDSVAVGVPAKVIKTLKDSCP
jgi:acetyltransferase-like isoleucine patch superfamily enzyme